MEQLQVTRPPEKETWRDYLLSLPKEKRLHIVKTISPAAAYELKYNWLYHARKEQWEPEGDWWDVWVICAGRGFGKTRTGAQWIIENAMQGYMRQALIGPTSADVSKVMIEGESGIFACARPDFYPQYKSKKHNQLIFPNGAIVEGFSAEKPDRLRGPQFEAAWCDELAAWTRDRDSWDMLRFGVRLGKRTKILVTTTPRPRPLLKEILKSSTTVVTRGSTFDNSKNLNKEFLQIIKKKYEGTRLGRQELNAEMLDDVEGALWTREMIERNRVTEIPDQKRIVVALDPPTTDNENSAECGIIGMGLGKDDLGYVLEDKSRKGTPLQWGTAGVALFNKLKADIIIAEANTGGDLIEHLILSIDKKVPYRKVYAARNKQTRAEPIASFSEQDRIKFFGTFPELEDQLCNWVPGDDSPDRLDAMVWAASELMLKHEREYRVI